MAPEYLKGCTVTGRPSRYGGAENDGHENDGPSKLQGMKLQDMKLQDMTRIDRILLNFNFFFLHSDADVAAMELCNVIMKWIEKRSNDTRDKSASGVIWVSNSTNDINMQH